MIQRAYLDIETTGFSRLRSELTVIGIGIERGVGVEMHQLYGSTLSAGRLLDVLDGVRRVYTYNGRRFDLPFIKQKLGCDIELLFTHIDLMYFCWRNNLKGGLKKVEQSIGIVRELPDVDGYDAVRWWRRYVHEDDREALDLLLRYNAEDVENLKKLRQHLHVF